MNRVNFLFVFTFSIFTTYQSHAQLASGMDISPYSGINGAITNPASAPYSVLPWDVNLAGVHTFGHTDYAYALNSNLFHFLSNATSLIEVPRDTDALVLDPNLNYYDFLNDNKASTATALWDVRGPSVLINFNTFSAGLFSRARVQGGSHNISGSLDHGNINTAVTSEAFTVKKSNLAAMAWAEYGASFSTDQLLPIDGISVGINIKYLRGYQGGYIRNLQPLEFTRTGDTLTLSDPQLEMGFTTSLADTESFQRQVNGSGIGADIGVSTVINGGILNVSVLDIGGIKYNNAEIYRFISNDPISINTDLITTSDGIRNQVTELDNQLSNTIADTSNLIGNQIRIGLPTRLHIDYTLPITDKISVAAAIDQRMPFRPVTVQAENVMTISPRYDTKWLSLSLPISIYEYESIRIGAAAKIAFITIGSDNIMSLFGNRDFKGSSVYASVRVFPFRDSSRAKGKGVRCPDRSKLGQSRIHNPLSRIK